MILITRDDLLPEFREKAPSLLRAENHPGAAEGVQVDHDLEAVFLRGVKHQLKFIDFSVELFLILFKCNIVSAVTRELPADQVDVPLLQFRKIPVLERNR